MTSNQNPNNHLFTLRIWGETDVDGRLQWRGKLHHLKSHHVRYFNDWPALIPVLLAMLRQLDAPPEPAAGDAREQSE